MEVASTPRAVTTTASVVSIIAIAAGVLRGDQRRRLHREVRRGRHFGIAQLQGLLGPRLFVAAIRDTVAIWTETMTGLGANSEKSQLTFNFA